MNIADYMTELAQTAIDEARKPTAEITQILTNHGTHHTVRLRWWTPASMVTDDFHIDTLGRVTAWGTGRNDTGWVVIDGPVSLKVGDTIQARPPRKIVPPTPEPLPPARRWAGNTVCEATAMEPRNASLGHGIRRF